MAKALLLNKLLTSVSNDKHFQEHVYTSTAIENVYH